MKIVHSARGKEVKVESTDTDSFLLTNKHGSYLYCSPLCRSKYQGFFFFDDFKMYRVLEDIRVVGADDVDTIVNKFSSVERHRKDLVETFFVPEGHHGFHYQLSEKKEIELFFDCKDSYDDREFGRFYDVIEEGGVTILKFTKRTDDKEDDSHGMAEYNLYVAMLCDGSFKKCDDWVKREYEDDTKRQKNFRPRYVFKGLSANCKSLYLAVSKTKQGAMDELNNMVHNHDNLRIECKIKPKTEDNMAYLCAVDSINKLTVDDKGLFAGLPWFFQYWTRDEMISLGSLIVRKKYGLVKKLLFKYLDKFKHDGRLPNRLPVSLLGSADGTGWFFVRLDEFVDALRKDKIMDEYISVVDMRKIKSVLERSVFDLLKFHTREGLDYAEKNETWMDTDFGGDYREGFTIELQALRIRMYRLLAKVSEIMGDQIAHQMAVKSEKEMLLKIREGFVSNGLILDSVGDSAVRPNVFLAYYICPDLFSAKIWRLTFRNALNNLFLKWGGLSTIGKDSPLYVDHYTGESNRSYHRGDSWYWVNNIAAVSMKRLGNIRYRKYIDAIFRASKNDVLANGIIGHCSEVSSAGKQDSNGCGAQLWSAATFVELVHELHK